MQSVETTIRVSTLEDEISRLRLIIGTQREQLWKLLMWMDPELPITDVYQAETDKLMYGGQL